MRSGLVIAVSTILISGCAAARTEAKIGGEGMATARRLMNEGAYVEAETRLQRLLQESPSNAVAHFHLATCYGKRGKLAMAAEGYHVAIGLDPNLMRAYYNLGTTYLIRRQHRLAQHWLEKGLELDPDHVPSYVNLARAYYELGLPDIAGSAYEEALKRDPNSENALANMTRICAAAGKTKLAREYLVRLTEASEDKRSSAELKSELGL
jgi:Tfp pilus assembly protein PilF